MTDREMIERLCKWMGFEVDRIDEAYQRAAYIYAANGSLIWWSPLHDRNDCVPLLDKMAEQKPEVIVRFSTEIKEQWAAHRTQAFVGQYTLGILRATPRQICEAVIAAIGESE